MFYLLEGDYNMAYPEKERVDQQKWVPETIQIVVRGTKSFILGDI